MGASLQGMRSRVLPLTFKKRPSRAGRLFSRLVSGLDAALAVLAVILGVVAMAIPFVDDRDTGIKIIGFVFGIPAVVVFGAQLRPNSVRADSLARWVGGVFLLLMGISLFLVGVLTLFIENEIPGAGVAFLLVGGATTTVSA